MNSVPSPSHIILLMVVFVGVACSLIGDKSQLYEQKSGHRLLVVSSALSTRSLHQCSLFCLMMKDPLCLSFSYNSLTSTCQLSIYTTALGGGGNDSTVIYQVNGIQNDADYVYNQYSGTCYKLYTDMIYRDAAAANCENEGDMLATFRTAESYQWLVDLTLADTDWGAAKWLGLYKVGDVWTWNGNTTDVHTYSSIWCSGGQPDSVCVYMTGGTQCGYSYGCARLTKAYICEKVSCGL